MTDIVDQLRDRAYSGKAGDPLCERAADEIVTLRRACRYVDAMLRSSRAGNNADEAALQPAKCTERETDHGAAPAATARTDAAAGEPGGGGGSDRTDKPAPRTAVGTGDIPDSRTRDIVTRLRRWCHAADAESAQDLMDEAADEIERLRLRRHERDAIAAAAESVQLDDDSNWTTLMELLRRHERDGILRSPLVRVRPEWEKT